MSTVGPTARNVRLARKTAGLTQSQSANLVYSTLKTWQNWESDGKRYTPMPKGLFELFLIKTNIKNI